jgi:hypothetical protein
LFATNGDRSDLGSGPQRLVTHIRAVGLGQYGDCRGLLGERR